jgi:hypothetical protein
MPRATPRPDQPAQLLRIRNLGAVDLHNLVVIFPDQRIAFGDVPAGATSEYRPAPGGVYRYAAYEVEIGGQFYQQPVIDWVGETPMPGDAFTYTLDADPARQQAGDLLVRVVEVSQDARPTGVPGS